jgi:hypothetical protein
MYPSWRYHKKEEPKLIHSEKEEHHEWLDNPGKFLPEDHVEHVPSKLSVKEAEQIAEAADLSPSLDEELGKVKRKGKK